MSGAQSPAATKLSRILGAAALLAVAAVVAALTAPTVVQAFRGPRTVTEQELLATERPGWWDNYVRFRPPAPALDTGLRYGKKGNEGTKYVLLPLGGSFLFCSTRVNDGGPEYVGRLESRGGTEEEVIRRMGGNPGLLPFMLQAVRSIWFDTVVVLLVVVGCLGGAVWMLAQVFLFGRKGDQDRPRRRRPAVGREESAY